jgi:hypothetical protein
MAAIAGGVTTLGGRERYHGGGKHRDDKARPVRPVLSVLLRVCVVGMAVGEAASPDRCNRRTRVVLRSFFHDFLRQDFSSRAYTKSIMTKARCALAGRL